jgi:WD40 repeat protein
MTMDAATGIQLTLPQIDLRGPSASKFGSSWTAPGEELLVETLRFTDRTLDALMNTIRNRAGRRITNESGAADRFVLEGTDTGQYSFYFAAERNQNEIRAISISYTSKVRDRALALARSVQLFARPANVVAEPGRPQPTFKIVPQRGHPGIGAALISASGKVVASNGEENSIRLWDAHTGRLLRTIEKLPGDARNYVKILSISPDGLRLLSDQNSSAILWDTQLGKSLLSIDHNLADPVMSADGTKLISAAKDGRSVDIWDAVSARKLGSFRAGNTDIAQLAISPNGKFIAVQREDGAIGFWDGQGKPQTGANLTGKSQSLIFSPDSLHLLVVGGTDGESKLVDVPSGRVGWTVIGAKDVKFFPDGRHLVSDDGQRNLKVWDSKTGSQVSATTVPIKSYSVATFYGARIIVGDDEARSKGHAWIFDAEARSEAKWEQSASLVGSIIGISPTGDKVLLSTDGEWQIRKWDGTLVQRVEDQTVETNLGLSTDGSRLAQLDAAGGIMIRDTGTWGAQKACSGIPPGTSRAVFASDGASIAVTTTDQSDNGRASFSICDLGSRKLLQKQVAGDTSALSSDGHLVAAAGDNKLQLLDVATGKVVRTLTQDVAYSASIAFAARDRFVFAGADVNRVRGWDLSTGKELQPFRILVGPVTAVGVSQDGRTAAAGSTSRFLVKVWDTGTGKLQRVLETVLPDNEMNKLQEVGSVVFSADSRALAAVFGNRISSWDFRTGKVITTIKAENADFAQVAFSADGKRLISLDSDGVVQHWDAATGALIATIATFRNDEWVILTPEGFFEASQNGAKLLAVVQGLEGLSIDQIYNALHRPDLVKEKLAGDPQGKVREAAAKLDLTKAVASGSAPRVAIAAPATGAQFQDEQINVEVDVTDLGGGIGKVEWRVNGVTLGIEERGIKRVSDQGEPAGGGNTPSTTFPAGQVSPARSIKISRTLGLAPGENRIAVLAYNEAGLIASEPSEITVTSIQQASAKPRLYVLSVGVNDYWDSALRLSFAAPDAKTLGDGLKQAGSKLYERVEVRSVLDGDATTDKLDGVFAELGKQVRPQDVFVFFLAGHGKTEDARFYFLPQDFHYVGEDSVAKKGVGQDRLQEWFSRIKAQKSVLLFDACESGSLIGDKIAMRGIEEKTAIDRMTRAMGRTVLTATTDSKPAIEGYRGHGVFTYTVLAGLGSADTNGDGVIDVTELAQYVDSRLPELTYDAFKLRQVPQMSIVGSNFPLASKVSLLPVDTLAIPSTANIPTKPTHVVIAPATVRQAAAPTGAVVTELPAGTQVAVVKTEGGWTIVARDGKQLGFVDDKQLAKLQ